jgi:hypothetical protein
MTNEEAGKILSAALDGIVDVFGAVYTATLVLRPKNGAIDAAIVIGNDDLVVDLNQQAFIRKASFEGIASRDGLEPSEDCP